VRRLALVLALAACGHYGFSGTDAARDSASDAALDPSLVGDWRLDDGAGTTAIDSSGLGNNGTLVGSPTWVTGELGGALAFDGATSYVDIPAKASLANIPVKTVTAWIQLGASAAHAQIFVGKDASVACGWEFSVQPNLSIEYHQCFDQDGQWQTPPSTIAVGEWHHVAVVYDRTSTANLPTIYFDGAAQSLNVVEIPMGSEADESTKDVGIAGNAIDQTEDFAGKIDDVRIYTRALSTAEIQALP